MRILIVGGSGFVGSYLYDSLKQHHSVKMTYFSSDNSGIKYNAETDSISDLVTEKFDIVINNVNPERLSFTGVSKNIESVIEYCKNNSAKLIQISSFFASADNRNSNSYALKKAISEDIIQSEMTSDSYAILRFAQLFDYNGLSRKTQGGLYYLAESVKKKIPLNLFANHANCPRNYMPVELLIEIVEQVISHNIKGLHNAYFNSFTLSFKELIATFDKFNGDDYNSPLELGTRDGMSYSIEKESHIINELIEHEEVGYYLRELFNSLNVN